MSNLQVKDIPKPMHDELRRRAELAGKSLRDYVLDLIRRDLAAPSREQWLAAVRELEPVYGGPPAAEIIAEERKARDRRGARR